MPITHTNAKGQTFTLYQGTTKTGKAKYYFAMQSEGTRAKAISAGYEIYENPNAQVFLRRIPPKIITDEERRAVEEGMRRYATVKDYKIDVKGNAILIYTSEQDLDALANLFKHTHPNPLENVELMTTLRNTMHYSPMLVFQLVDATRRTFQTQWAAVAMRGVDPYHGKQQRRKRLREDRILADRHRTDGVAMVPVMEGDEGPAVADHDAGPQDANVKGSAPDGTTREARG